MKKRGQVTLFIIFGIVIVAIIGVGLYLKSSIIESAEKARLAEREAFTQKEIEIAKSIDDCVTHTLKNSIIEISRNGGYYPLKENSISYLSFNVPIYFDKGKEKVPDKNDFAVSIAKYVDENLETCLPANIEILRKPESEITLGNTIKADVEMLVQVSESRLKRFSGEINTKYQDTFAEVKEFYDIVRKFKETRDVVEIGRRVVDKGYKYSVANVDDKTLYFMIWDDYIDEKPLMFTFGLRTKFTEDFFADPLQFSVEGFDIEEIIEEQEDEEELTQEDMDSFVVDTQDNETESEEMGELFEKL